MTDDSTATGDNGTPLTEPVYLDVRKQYDEAELEVSGRYDTWILSLAGGALGLSLTFMEKIAPHPDPSTIGCLKWAWTVLVLSLLAALTSLVTSQSAIRENRDELDAAHEQGRAPRLSFPRWFTTLTNCLNWVSLGAFILGVWLLCTFTFRNIDLTTQTKGADDDKRQTNTTAAASINKRGLHPSAPTTTNGVSGLRSVATAQVTSSSATTTQGTIQVGVPQDSGAPAP
jgi:hypothetical protein